LKPFAGPRTLEKEKAAALRLKRENLRWLSPPMLLVQLAAQLAAQLAKV